MNKKPTLTIGIPAYNEEGNIANLIESILRQHTKNFVLEKVIVVCDCSSDDTQKIVKKFTKRSKKIELIEGYTRIGKAQRLNQIYKINRSDYLLTLDGDVVLDTNMELEHMIFEILKNKDTSVVGGRFIPVRQQTLMGKFSIASYESFEAAMLKLNDGNNMFALVGAASLLTKKLSKSFRYPEGTVSDQNYLYAVATKNNPNAVRIAKKSRIYIATVSSFKDWRVLGVRSLSTDKKNVTRYFGSKIMKHYTMPKSLLAVSFAKYMLKNPFYMTGSLLMNFYIRKFPYKKATPRKGVWMLTDSSKHFAI